MASAGAQTIQDQIISSTSESVIADSTVPLYVQLLALEESHGVVANTETFECVICLNNIEQGDGVRLRDCLHQFCRDCLKNTIILSDEAVVACPFGDGISRCENSVQHREIRAILSDSEHETFLKRTLRIAESMSRDAIHCKLANCDGWCICEDGVNQFNCLSCQAIHTGLDCKQHQDEIRYGNLDDTQRTQLCLDDIVANNLGMKCPQCQIVIMKRSGCDWLQCSMCRTEICWATKQARWGPSGRGDTSGGCRCKINSRPCHPSCGNCH